MKKDANEKKRGNRASLLGAAISICALCLGADFVLYRTLRPVPVRGVDFACKPGGRDAPPVLFENIEAAHDDRGLCADSVRYLMGYPININTARPDELALLPGIGARRARAIVAQRRKIGSFQNPAEFASIPGLTAPVRASLDLWADVK